jgi:hypothetical protein
MSSRLGHWGRIAIGAAALLLGGYMLADGIRALAVGDYFTPGSGEHAGELGPWSGLVASVGVDPRSTGMKVAFVAFGAAWLAGLVAFVRRVPRAARFLAVLGLATIWYLPFGTLLGLLVAVLARRTETRAEA